MYKKLISAFMAISMAITVTPASTVIAEDMSIDVSNDSVLTEGDNTEMFDVPISENTVEHAYDPFAELEEQQAEEELRESTDITENTVIFSVKEPRRINEPVSYLDDGSKLCTDYSLKNVEMIYETKLENGICEVFYLATVNTTDIWALVDKLNEDNRISTAEPDYIWESTASVSSYKVSEDEFNKSTHFPGMGVVGVWNNLYDDHVSAPGAGTVVAVIDTGVDYTHIDLKDNMWKNSGEIAGNGIDDDGNGYVDDVYGYDFVENDGTPMDDMGHGTHVAGIIAMSKNNVGGVGLAYGAKIMAIKAGQATGSFASTDIAKAIKYAADNGADVINMSFGGTGRSYLVESALKDASHNCVLIAAAGNDGLPTTDHPVPCEDFYPAGYDYVLGVMATDKAGNFAGFSNWDYIIGANCEYELAAPGVSIYSTLPGNRYAYWSGTSMAAPNVAAAAAILRSRFRDKNKYTSRFIMGQLTSATDDATIKYDDKGNALNTYPLLNIKDSLTKTPTPEVILKDFYIFDDPSISSNNNGDGIAQPGEIIDIGISAFNYWGIADDVTIKIDSLSIADIPNPHVELINDTVNIGSIGTFATGNNGYTYTDGALIGVSNPLRIKIKEGTANDIQIPINFTVTCKNGMDDADASTYSGSGRSQTIIVQNGVALSGVIEHDMTLKPDNYWIIQNNLLIPEGVTVTVEPGTQIQFWSADPSNPYADEQTVFIQVDGRLIAEGNEENPIQMFPGKGFEEKTVAITSCDFNHLFIDNIKSKKIFDDNTSDTYTCLKYINFINGCGIHTSNIDYAFCATTIDHCKFSINELYHYNEGITAREITNTIVENYCNFGNGIGNRPRAHISGRIIDTCLFSNESVNLSDANDLFKNSVVINEKMDTPNRVMYEFDLDFNHIVSDNAFLGKIGLIPNNLIRFCGSRINQTFNASNNYWGTSNPDLVKIQCYDADLIVSLGQIIQEPFLTLEDDMSAIYPFVTEAYLTDKDSNRIDTVNGKQPVSLHVKFNRDMAQDIQPMVTYGGSAPYTDYAPSGTWVSAREWRADFTIDPFIEMGRMYIRIKGAAAADDKWLVTGEDTERFFFEVTNTGAQAMTLQGSGASGANTLNWVQDDFDTFAGYNLYRSRSSNGTFTKINTTILSEENFSDTNVEQGKDYYYYFTVVDTAFNESKPSNVVKCTPVDEEAPVITHTPIAKAPSGEAITINANVTDNVRVDSVSLYYRNTTDNDWHTATMRNVTGSTYRAVISAYDVTEGTIEYYVTAYDGTNTAYSGTQAEPNSVVIDVEHNFDNGTVKKAATCTEPGEKVYKCQDCGYEKTEVLPALGHDYSEEWTTDKAATCTEVGEKSHHCTRCGAKSDITVIPKEAHVWDAGKITKSNSCTDDGVKHFKCIYCDEEKDEVVLATGHNYVDTVHHATCTEQGYTEHICQNCNAVYKSDFTPKSDHEYEETIINPATCTTNGLKRLVCKHCNDTKNVEIPATGHKYIDTIHPATCTERGYTEHVCQYCGSAYEDNFTPVCAHIFEDTIVDPTEEHMGYTLHSCKNCDYFYKDTFTELEDGGTIRIPGDVNDDNTVDLLDVVLIRRYLAGGWDITINLKNADVNGDEVVDLMDVVLIRRYLAGGWDVTLV